MDTPIVSQKDNLDLEVEQFAKSLLNFGFTQKGVEDILGNISTNSGFLAVAEIYKYMTDEEIQVLDTFNQNNKRDDLQLIELDRISQAKTGSRLEDLQNLIVHNLLITTIQELQRLVQYGSIFAKLTETQNQEVAKLIADKNFIELESYLNKLG
jgi:hypothetical protein